MKTNLDAFFKTNDDLEKNGVWFEIAEGIGFLVRPFKATNPNVKAAMANFYKPFAKQIEMGTLDDAKSREIQIKLFLKACLLDWKGVVIDDKPTEYSPEVALPFFMNLPDLFEALWKHCQDFKNYQAEEVGNSSADT